MRKIASRFWGNPCFLFCSHQQTYLGVHGENKKKGWEYLYEDSKYRIKSLGSKNCISFAEHENCQSKKNPISLEGNCLYSYLEIRSFLCSVKFHVTLRIQKTLKVVIISKSNVNMRPSMIKLQQVRSPRVASRLSASYSRECVLYEIHSW